MSVVFWQLRRINSSTCVFRLTVDWDTVNSSTLGFINFDYFCIIAYPDMVPPLVLFERLSQKDKKALTAIHHSQTPKFVVRRDNGSGNRGIASDQGGKNLCKAPVLPSTEGAEVSK